MTLFDFAFLLFLLVIAYAIRPKTSIFLLILFNN